MRLLDRLGEPHGTALSVMRRAFRQQPTWRAALLGGAVRDLYVGRQPRDLDFVVEGCAGKDELRGWADMLCASVQVTGFGGLRFEVAGVPVDAWRVDDNAIGAGPGRWHGSIQDVLAGGVTLTTDACAVILGDAPDGEHDVECTTHLAHALERGEVGVISATRLKPTIVLARAAKACVGLGLRPGPSLVEFARANAAVCDVSFKVALDRHHSGMTPARAREVLGMPTAAAMRSTRRRQPDKTRA